MVEKHTLKEILKYTQQVVPNRYEYRKRDVVKRILIKEVVEVERHDLPGQARKRIRYEVLSKSWPQYYPYFTKIDSRGRSRMYQRTTAHHYDLTLQLDRLSINTTEWTGRLGSMKTWNKKPPQNQIKTIYPANKTRWTQKRKDLHKKRAPYLDVGDYNSQVNGINGDFIFRCAFSWWLHKHLFGRNYYGNVPSKITNPMYLLWFPKHFINLIDMLMQRGVLKDD